VKERERLARELHDSVTQSLYSVTLLSEAGRQLAEAGDLVRIGGYLERLGEISQQALREMRLLVYELRPLVLRREGLAGALQQRLDAVEKRAGVDARLLVEGEGELPSPVEEALYRIAQEALNNALKHASANNVTVYVRSRDGLVELEVVDDGVGFDLSAVEERGGLGLTSMRERAEKIGGKLDIISAPGKGTRVRACTKFDRESRIALCV
jgi:signal transduction histidine kinase